MSKILKYILYFIGLFLIGYYISSNVVLFEMFKYVLVLIFLSFMLFGIVYFYSFFNINREYRYIHHRHISFLILDIVIILLIYLGMYIYNLVNGYVIDISVTESISILIILIYMAYKSIYKTYFEYCFKKGKFKNWEYIPRQYYLKDGKYYLFSSYVSLRRVFKYLYIIINIILIVIMFLVYFIYNIDINVIIKSVIDYCMVIPLLIYELYIYFDGNINDKDDIKVQDKSIIKRKILWGELDREYYRLWKGQLLGRYNVINKYESHIIDDTVKCDSVSQNIVKSISDNKSSDFLYSRILSPIMEGKDIIVESCLMDMFSDIIVPIINVMFTASKKMLFICDNYKTVKECEKWLEMLEIKSNVANSNIVVDVLSYDMNDSLKMDSKVDIYIGTVDLALDSKVIFENIDVVFGINIDRIISDSAVNLNLLASVITGYRKDSVQYVLFSNRVNELTQTISQVLMRNDFVYQVINNNTCKNLNANFWATEKGWFQSVILPGYASQYLGQLIPLSIPAFKYKIEHVDVVSANQSSNDQMLALQTTQSLLKKYMNKDIVNLDEAIKFSDSENFLDIKDDSVFIVGDTYNNAALMLLNYFKYTKKNMFLNVVSQPYLLRDYIVSNIDFFIGNVDAIGNILPVAKTNIKLSVYKLINQLCYGNVLEEVLLRQIRSLETDKKIDTFENDQVRFVTEVLQELTNKAFGRDIHFASYLTSQKDGIDESLNNKRYYKLLESVKNELPDRLFKIIKFIDSEQSAKVLKRVPVFELYQNYLEGQYISFDSKYYLIDRIDYDNGIVDLKYSSNTNSVRYRQRRSVSNVIHHGINKNLPIYKVRDSILKKYILSADIEVNTDGYYEFNNAISFVPGEFGFKEVDINKKGLRRKYKSTNVLVVNISSKSILEMDDIDKFKLSFTLSLLLNELFETLFYNIKQYILVRSVVNSKNIYDKYIDDGLIRLYEPIIDSDIEDGINIYITEDTELEKGITDTIVNNFDNVIMRVLYDYLYWVLKEEDSDGSFKWYESRNGDYVNIEGIDRLLFLKYGYDNVREYIDLELVFNCLNELILEGNDTLTYSRLDFINKRKIDDKFKIDNIDS